MENETEKDKPKSDPELISYVTKGWVSAPVVWIVGFILGIIILVIIFS